MPHLTSSGRQQLFNLSNDQYTLGQPKEEGSVAQRRAINVHPGMNPAQQNQDDQKPKPDGLYNANIISARPSTTPVRFRSTGQVLAVENTPARQDASRPKTVATPRNSRLDHLDSNKTMPSPARMPEIMSDMLTVNGVVYINLGQLGKGGSCVVYKVNFS